MQKGNLEIVNKYIERGCDVVQFIDPNLQLVQVIYDDQYLFEFRFESIGGPQQQHDQQQQQQHDQQQQQQHDQQQQQQDLETKIMKYLKQGQEYEVDKAVQYEGVVFRIVDLDLVGEMINSVLDGRIGSVVIKGNRINMDQKLSDKVLMAGSFNPFHQGHYNIAQKSQQLFANSKEIVYELGITNPDKGDLNKQQILDRIQIFRKKGLNIRISKKFLFFDVSKDYENSLICVGYDTIVRVFMEKYYKNGVDDICSGFKGIQDQQNQFVVFGRDSGAGFKEFKSYLEQSCDQHVGLIYQKYKDCFLEVDELQFRIDISSSEIRNKTKVNLMQ